MIERLFKLVARYKVYLSRTISYVSILNFLLIFATFKKTYNIQISLFILLPICIFVTLLVGFIDYRIILRHETEFNNQQNNVKHQIDRVEQKIDKLIKNQKTKK